MPSAHSIERAVGSGLGFELKSTSSGIPCQRDSSVDRTGFVCVMVHGPDKLRCRLVKTTGAEKCMMGSDAGAIDSGVRFEMASRIGTPRFDVGSAAGATGSHVL